jgi:hypothetical protein
VLTRAFLSFVEEDLGRVILFRGQAKNERLDLEFADYSVKEPFDSLKAEYIGRCIADQIRPATLTICLYGPTTYTSARVDWELRKTLDFEKPIMGVCLCNDGLVPIRPLALSGQPCVPWEISAIVSTMGQLARGFRGLG